MIVRVASQLRASLLAAILLCAACAGTYAQDLSGYSGSGLYRTYCASCHGVKGQGDGPVASSLRAEVPNLTRLALRQGGRFPADQVRMIVDGRATLPPHGTRDMPVWGQTFRAAGANDPQAERRADGLIDLLIEYLRSIQEK